MRSASRFTSSASRRVEATSAGRSALRANVAVRPAPAPVRASDWLSAADSSRRSSGVSSEATCRLRRSSSPDSGASSPASLPGLLGVLSVSTSRSFSFTTRSLSGW